MRLLSTTTEIQREVVRLMQPGTRRVAITAFVGAGASAYIPKPKGVTIVCWPKAGGTNPDAVRELLRRHADVRFSDRVHMKVYWSRGRGAVIGSANLTTNALGSGSLKELAVLLPARVVPIDKILTSLATRLVSRKELNRLEREHRKLGSRLTGTNDCVSFRHWFEMKSRNPWKIGSWDEEVNYSQQAKATAKANFGRSPVNSIWGRAREHSAGDWVLSFRISKNRVDSIRWLFVNFVVRAGPKNDAYPFEAAQVWTSRECTTPPFSVTRAFARALTVACRGFGITKLKSLRNVTPPQKWLRAIYDEMPG